MVVSNEYYELLTEKKNLHQRLRTVENYLSIWRNYAQTYTQFPNDILKLVWGFTGKETPLVCKSWFWIHKKQKGETGQFFLIPTTFKDFHYIPSFPRFRLSRINTSKKFWSMDGYIYAKEFGSRTIFELKQVKEHILELHATIVCCNPDSEYLDIDIQSTSSHILLLANTKIGFRKREIPESQIKIQFLPIKQLSNPKFITSNNRFCFVTDDFSLHQMTTETVSYSDSIFLHSLTSFPLPISHPLFLGCNDQKLILISNEGFGYIYSICFSKEAEEEHKEKQEKIIYPASFLSMERKFPIFPKWVRKTILDKRAVVFGLAVGLRYFVLSISAHQILIFNLDGECQRVWNKPQEHSHPPVTFEKVNGNYTDHLVILTEMGFKTYRITSSCESTKKIFRKSPHLVAPSVTQISIDSKNCISIHPNPNGNSRSNIQTWKTHVVCTNCKNHCVLFGWNMSCIIKERCSLCGVMIDPTLTS